MKVEIYTKDWCSFCKAAKYILDSKDISYVEYDVTHNTELESEMIKRSQFRTVPQIFIDQQYIGGYEALVRLRSSGKLAAIAQQS